MNVSKCGKTLAAAWAAVMVMAAATAAEYKPDGPDGTITQAVDAPDYIIDRAVTGVNTYVAVKNGSQVTQGTLQQVLDYIRSQSGGCTGNCPAVPVAPVSIQFGDGTNVLDIGNQSAGFYNSEAGVGGGTWSPITLSGKITSAIGNQSMANEGGWNATIVIGSGVSVTSNADIANTATPTGGGLGLGTAIAIQDGGTVRIIGGTTEAILSINGSGSVVLGGSPTIIGNIGVQKEKLSVITTGTDVFAPAGKQYAIAISNASAAGDIAVVGGANFASNFTLANNPSYYLSASGNNLVLFSVSSPETRVVTFNSGYGPNYNQQNVPNGGKVTRPPNPIRENYTFGGWYKEAAYTNEWNFDNGNL